MSAPDQAYGKRTAQEQSQKILPIQTPGIAAPSASTAIPAATPNTMEGMGAGPTGADQGGLGAPTASPAPATQGLPQGPGAGPEIAGPLMKQHLAMQASEQGTLQTLLTHLSSQPGASSITKALASAAGIH